MRPPPYRIDNNGSSSNSVFYFLSGVSAVLTAYSMYTHLKTFHDRNAVHLDRRRRETQRHEANKRIEDCRLIALHAHYVILTRLT